MSDDSTPTEKDRRNLTPAEWSQVVVLWESGSVTLKDLEDRFGVTKSSLSDGLKKRGAVKGRRAGEFAKQAEESLKSEAQRRIENIRGFKDEYHKYGDFIMKATVKEISELLKENPRTAETKRRIFTALKYSAEIYAICRDQRYHLFDLYNEQIADEDLPEIAIAEYTPEELEQIRNRFEVPVLEPDDEILAEAERLLTEMAS